MYSNSLLHFHLICKSCVKVDRPYSLCKRQHKFHVHFDHWKALHFRGGEWQNLSWQDPHVSLHVCLSNMRDPDQDPLHLMFTTRILESY